MRWDISNTDGRPEEFAEAAHLPSEREVEALVTEALPPDVGLTQLKGFKMNLSANPGFRKVFFSARCECGTAAVLSVEVSEEKTVGEIRQALPMLISKLEAQSQTFYKMSCEMHQRMRMGPAAARSQ